MAFFAHADDEVIGCGGLLANEAQEGIQPIVIAFFGNRQRKKEFEAACKVLKAKPVFLGLDPSRMDKNKTKEKLIKLIREHKPAYYITHSKWDYHKEHEIAREIAMDAIEFAGHGTEKTGWVAEQVLFTETNNMIPRPTIIIDISSTIKTKLEALECHKSQLETDYKKKYYTDLINGKARLRGIQSGVEFAEAFESIRMPIHANFYAKKRAISRFSDEL